MKGLISFITIAVIVAAATAVISWNFSGEIYTFFAKAYYGSYRLNQADSQFRTLQKLYKEKKHEQFEKLSKRLLTAYPKDKHLAKLVGNYYIEQGVLLKGTLLISESLSYNTSDAESLSLLLPVLYEQRLYLDLVTIMREYDLDTVASIPGVLFYYGVSLFEIGAYDDAEKVLSKGEGRTARAEFYRYLALIKEKHAETASEEEAKALLESAEFYLETARKYSPDDSAVERDYTRILKKLKKYEKAAEVFIQ